MIRFTPKHLSGVINKIIKNGERIASDRGDTIELQDVFLYVANPRDRIVTERWRKMNIGFAIVDALSHIVGDNTLPPLTQFVPSFSQYSSNGKTIDGSYGSRINRNDQLNGIISMLRENRDTRRAVVSIYCGPDDVNGGGGVNIPCTLNFHFLVRKGKLVMKALMRSNDVVLGLTNDIFTFTMLHEYVSVKTGIPLGHYVHYASSFHIYESDIKKYGSRFHENGSWANTLLMDSMPHDFDAFRTYQAISNLYKFSVRDCLLNNYGLKRGYEEDLFFTAAFVQKRHDKNAFGLYQMIENPALKYMASLWSREKNYENPQQIQGERN